jgi:hypothetical protein
MALFGPRAMSELSPYARKADIQERLRINEFTPYFLTEFFSVCISMKPPKTFPSSSAARKDGSEKGISSAGKVRDPLGFWYCLTTLEIQHGRPRLLLIVPRPASG